MHITTLSHYRPTSAVALSEARQSVKMISAFAGASATQCGFTQITNSQSDAAPLNTTESVAELRGTIHAPSADIPRPHVDDCDERRWYAMRATYRREIQCKEQLEQQGIECFIAMRKVVKKGRFNRRVTVMEPVVHNLLFARATREEISRAKAPIGYLQFMTMKEGRKNVPIIVPDKQMNDFIAVTQTYNDDLMFVDPDSITLSKGDKVRIHGGLFNGLEGVFVKVKGKRNKRVVIRIQNVIAVALAYVEPDFIEVIK